MPFATLVVMWLAAQPVLPPPDLALKGYVLARVEGASVAVLTSGSHTRIAKIGERVFGGELISVSPAGVVLEFGSERVTIRMSGTAAPAAPAAPPAAKPSEREPAAAGAPPETTTVNLPRADLDRRVALEMDRILAETALAPVTEDGRVTGVAIRRVASGTVLTEVGLRVGDVITEINGTHIDGLSTLMGLYTRLQRERLVSATVMRDGRPVQIKLSLE